MRILIGNTELTVINCYPYEYQNGKRELKIWIPQSEIEYSALKTVLNEENTGEIVLTKDDGTTQTFVGYNTTYEITDKTEQGMAVFYVVIQCVAEAERRALEAQEKAKELERLVNNQATLINDQAAAIENLSQQLLVVQLAAAELYEKSLEAETTEEIKEEPAEETIEKETEGAAESGAEDSMEETTVEPEAAENQETTEPVTDTEATIDEQTAEQESEE